MKRGAPSICATAVIKEKRMLAAEVSVSKHNRIRIRYTRCDTFLQFELDASVCTVVLALFDLAGFFFFTTLFPVAKQRGRDWRPLSLSCCRLRDFE